MKNTISIKKLDKVMRAIFKTFKGWEIEIDLEKKENGVDVKSIKINITYNESWHRGE